MQTQEVISNGGPWFGHKPFRGLVIMGLTQLSIRSRQGCNFFFTWKLIYVLWLRQNTILVGITKNKNFITFKLPSYHFPRNLSSLLFLFDKNINVNVFHWSERHCRKQITAVTAVACLQTTNSDFFSKHSNMLEQELWTIQNKLYYTVHERCKLSTYFSIYQSNKPYGMLQEKMWSKFVLL